MKIRHLLITLLAVLILVFLFRGLLWRAFVSYEDIKIIPLQSLTDKTLKEKIKVDTEKMDGKEIVKYCRNLTSDCLSFSMHHAEHDINKMYPQGKTHCVGCAAFFAAVCKYAFQLKEIECDIKHVRGRIHVFGIDVHKPFRNIASLKDHDYVRVDIGSDIITVDPSIEDVLSMNPL